MGLLEQVLCDQYVSQMGTQPLPRNFEHVEDEIKKKKVDQNRESCIIFLVKTIYNMLTLTFNFKVKLGVNRCKNMFLANIFLLLVGRDIFPDSHV